MSVIDIFSKEEWTAEELECPNSGVLHRQCTFKCHKISEMDHSRICSTITDVKRCSCNGKKMEIKNKIVYDLETGNNLTETSGFESISNVGNHKWCYVLKWHQWCFFFSFANLALRLAKKCQTTIKRSSSQAGRKWASIAPMNPKFSTNLHLQTQPLWCPTPQQWRPQK